MPSAVHKMPKALGGFEILGLLGRGGMGAVFKARQPGLDRVVALKVLDPEFGADPEFIERFKIEARATAQLVHPNIVHGIDVGRDAATGWWYFAMEYVEGTTAEALLKNEGVLPEARALEIARDVACALECAEKHGIVHRDIKPGNILLEPRGTARVTDLGLARRTRDTKANLTQAGNTVGTPYYMAPEQVEGRIDKIDARTDLYALGATLFHFVTGEPVFDGSSGPAIMAQHLGARPPLANRVNPEVSEACARLIDRLLQKDPNRRPAQAAVVIAEIERLQARPVRMSPGASSGRRRGTGTRMAPLGLADSSRALQPVALPAGDEDDAASAPSMRRVRSVSRRQSRQDATPLFVAAAVVVLALLAWLALGDGGSTAPRSHYAAPVPAPEIPAAPAPTGTAPAPTVPIVAETQAGQKPPAPTAPEAPAPAPAPVAIAPASALPKPAAAYRGTWTQIECGGETPKARACPNGHLAYDIKRNRMLLYSGHWQTMNDLWSFDASTKTWTCLMPNAPKDPEVGKTRPPGVMEMSFQYLEGLDRFWTSFGWMYDPQSGGWSNLCQDPKKLSGADLASGRRAMAWDPDGKRFLTLYPTGERNWPMQYWFIDGASPKKAPKGKAPVPVRNYLDDGLAYDRAKKIFVLFGGRHAGKDGTGLRDDTWIFDPGKDEWSEAKPAVRPPGRDRHTLRYVERLGEHVLLAGQGTTQKDVLGDVWLYSVTANRWTQADAPNGPAPGPWAADYDRAHDLFLVFTPSGQTWTLSIKPAP